MRRGSESGWWKRRRLNGIFPNDKRSRKDELRKMNFSRWTSKSWTLKDTSSRIHRRKLVHLNETSFELNFKRSRIHRILQIEGVYRRSAHHLASEFRVWVQTWTEIGLKFRLWIFCSNFWVSSRSKDCLLFSNASNDSSLWGHPIRMPFSEKSKIISKAHLRIAVGQLVEAFIWFHRQGHSALGFTTFEATFVPDLWRGDQRGLGMKSSYSIKTE